VRRNRVITGKKTIHAQHDSIRTEQSAEESHGCDVASEADGLKQQGGVEQHSEMQQMRDQSVFTMPQNLKIVIDCDLDTIDTGQACSDGFADGVVDLGGLMAQKGLYPCSKLASAQSLIVEHGLSSSFNKVLEGGARHLRGVFGRADDLGLFDALRKELGRGEGAWSRGTKGSARIKWSIPGLNGCGLLDGEIVQDLHGDELPAFSFVLRSLADSVDAEMLSWWVNIYEESSIGLGFHHDHQSNNQGLRWGRIFDVTAGASFGACRELTFRHAATSREFGFSQANGDVFAFDTQTDKDFMHGIYKQKKCCGPRISVIIVGKLRKGGRLGQCKEG
jgi:hypothetical protein